MRKIISLILAFSMVLTMLTSMTFTAFASSMDDLFEDIAIEVADYADDAQLKAAYDDIWTIILDNADLFGISGTEIFSAYAALSETPYSLVESIAIRRPVYTEEHLDNFQNDFNAFMHEKGVEFLPIGDMLNLYMDEFENTAQFRKDKYIAMSDEDKATFATYMELKKPFADVVALEDGFNELIGGLLVETETFEVDETPYADDYYGIGDGVKALTATSAAGKSYNFGGKADVPGGLIIDKGDSRTATGKIYHYKSEGPSAKLYVDFDMYFDNFIGQDTKITFDVYDSSEKAGTYPFRMYFYGTDGTFRSGASGYPVVGSGFENDKWYHVRIVFNGSNASASSAAKNYDVYIDGVKVGGTIAATSSNSYKFPKLDTFAFSLAKITTSDESAQANVYVDNISLYKSNIFSPVPIDKSALLSGIRNAQGLMFNATYGEGAEDYPADQQAVIETAVADAIAVYESTDDVDVCNAALADLNAAIAGVEKNGRSVIGLAYNEATDMSNPSGDIYSYTPKVSLSRYPAGAQETVTPIISITDAETGKLWKTVAGDPQVLTHDGLSRVTHSLTPFTFDLATAPLYLDVETTIVKTLDNPVLYSYDTNTDETCSEIKYELFESYNGDDATLKYTIETVADDNVLLLAYGATNELLFVKKGITNAEGKIVFNGDVGTLPNQEIRYDIYSVAAGRKVSDTFTHCKATTVNSILESIKNVAPVNGECDTAAVAAIIAGTTEGLENSKVLTLYGGLLDLYFNGTNKIVSPKAAKAVWEFTNSTSPLDASVLEDLREIYIIAAEEDAMNMLQSDANLATILDRKAELSLTDKIGIGTNKDLYSAETIFRYKEYSSMTATDKAKVYSYIRQRNDYADYAAQKYAFEQAVILTLVNNAENTDTISEAIDNANDLLTNGATYTDSKATIKSKAASIIKDQPDFASLAALNAYIPTALQDAANSNPAGPGGGSTINKPIVGGNSIIGVTGATGTGAGTVVENVNTVSVPFTDIEGYDWAKTPITVMYNKGILTGKGENTFAPADAVKREEFVKMAVMLFNISSTSDYCKFADVSADDWFKPYVIAAVDNGIINGMSDTLFGSGNNITREQLAVISYNAAVKAGVKFKDETYYVPFVDEDNIADYAKEAVKKLAAAGVLNGKGDNLFAPTDYCTRAEAAKVLYGIFMLNYI